MAPTVARAVAASRIALPCIGAFAALYFAFGASSWLAPKEAGLALVLGALATASYLAAVPCYLIWVAAAAGAARTIGRHRSSLPSPTWAVLAYFTPLAFMLVPFVHMTRIARSSDPSDLPAGPAGRRRERFEAGAPILPWACAGWLPFILIVIATVAEGPPSYVTILSVVTSSNALAGVLCCVVVRNVTRCLVERDLRAADIEEGGDDDDDEPAPKRRRPARR